MPKNEKILSNNDSPIVITDTTGIFGGRKKHKSAAAHDNGFGQSTKGFTVHDKSPNNKDDYRPACLEFSNSNKVPIPADAESFEITYTASNDSSGPLICWSASGDSKCDAGDITFGRGFISSGANITLDVEVKSMAWSIDEGTPTSVPASGVTVHYCPGGKCTDSSGKDLCK